jgi:hypothetical protein
VDTVVDHAAMINGCLCVDYDRFPKLRSGTYSTHGENLAAVPDQSVVGYEGARVYDGKRDVASIFEPVHT